MKSIYSNRSSMESRRSFHSSKKKFKEIGKNSKYERPKITQKQENQEKNDKARRFMIDLTEKSLNKARATKRQSPKFRQTLKNSQQSFMMKNKKST